MAFWSGWEPWEKMVLVLAFSMVVVIIAGGCIAWYKKWKIRMYTQSSTEEAERTRTLYRQRYLADDIPFGARALESGVYVDGIYTPGQQTPRRNLTPYNADSSSMSTRSPSPPRTSRSSKQHRYTSYSPF